MEVRFRTKRLQRNYQESAKAFREWGQAVGKKYITRINQLYAVKDFHEAFNIRSMRLHPLEGNKKGELSIHLTERWRLIVRKGITEESVTIEEVNNHYGN